jgi:hypothetical protein
MITDLAPLGQLFWNAWMIASMLLHFSQSLVVRDGEQFEFFDGLHA